MSSSPKLVGNSYRTGAHPKVRGIESKKMAAGNSQLLFLKSVIRRGLFGKHTHAGGYWSIDETTPECIEFRFVTIIET